MECGDYIRPLRLGADSFGPAQWRQATCCITEDAIRIYASIGRGRMIGP